MSSAAEVVEDNGRGRTQEKKELEQEIEFLVIELETEGKKIPSKRTLRTLAKKRVAALRQESEEEP